ncbi:hypothetical protein ACTFSB_24030, partial [Bacillus cereus group sp. MYBK14-3]
LFTCNIVALSLTYSALLALLLRFAFLNSSTCNIVALSLTYLSLLIFLLRFVCPTFPYLHSFALCLP